jgi:hypothetical protein
VPAIVNPRFAAFTLPALSVAEARNQHRDLVRRLGAAGDALWIAELGDSVAERNRRAIWGAVNAPGDEASVSRDSLPLASRAFRLVERV